MAWLEDKWVEWDGIEPEGSYPNIRVNGVVGTHYGCPWADMDGQRSILRSCRSGLLEAIDAGDWNECHRLTWIALGAIHDMFVILEMACATNKWNAQTGELSAEDVMLKWLEKAGEVIG